MVILFLTHPGILIDITMPTLIPESIGYMLRGLWQSSWVLVMQSFSEGEKSTMAMMTYYFIFLIWMAIKVKIALSQAGR